MLQEALRTTVALLLLALAGCGGGEAPSAGGTPSESAPVDVRVGTLARAPRERLLFATGELQPDERVTVATKVPGRLASIEAERGLVVRAGQVLARLEAREYELRVAQAEAALAAARALLGVAEGSEEEVASEATAAVRLARAGQERARLDRERARALAQEGVDSQAALDRAETELRAAESRLQEALELVSARRATLTQRRVELEIARAQLAETTLEAPFDGIVQARQVSPGAYLAIGDGVCELVRVDPLRLVLDLPAADAARVAPGTEVRALRAGEREPLLGRVTRLAPALAGGSRTRAVEVALENRENRPLAGAFVEAHLVLDAAASTLCVPPGAVRTFAGLDKLLLVVDGVVEERRVGLGPPQDGLVEVLSGAAEGDVYVLEPGSLAAGARVRVVP